MLRIWDRKVRWSIIAAVKVVFSNNSVQRENSRLVLMITLLLLRYIHLQMETGDVLFYECIKECSFYMWKKKGEYCHFDVGSAVGVKQPDSSDTQQA